MWIAAGWLFYYLGRQLGPDSRAPLKHGLFVALTKRDPHFFVVFFRAVRHQHTLLP